MEALVHRENCVKWLSQTEGTTLTRLWGKSEYTILEDPDWGGGVEHKCFTFMEKGEGE